MAVVASALALAVSTASALCLVHVRQRPTDLPVIEEPDNWPISFALPVDCDPITEIVEKSDAINQFDFAGVPLYPSANGSHGAALYHYQHSPTEEAYILIAFRVLDEVSSLQQAFTMLTGLKPSDATPLQLGPMPGLVHESSALLATSRMVAAGWWSPGLAVLIEYHSPNSGAAHRRIFYSVCASLNLQAGWVTR